MESGIDWSEFPSPMDFNTQAEWALEFTKWRKSNRTSQTLFAIKLGISQGFVSAIETCRETISNITKEYLSELKANGPEAARTKRKELLIEKIIAG